MAIYSITMLGNARGRIRGAVPARTAGAISSAPAILRPISRDPQKVTAVASSPQNSTRANDEATCGSGRRRPK